MAALFFELVREKITSNVGIIEHVRQPVTCVTLLDTMLGFVSLIRLVLLNLKS